MTAMNFGHERETNPCGHHVRHRASPQVSALRLETEFEKSHRHEGSQISCHLPISGLIQDDVTGTLPVIRPLSRSSATEEVVVGSVTLDDVGDMVQTKQALTEAVLWPLQHPDTIQRLAVEPPRGVLLYGPPGCGKAFVVRALASTGRLSVHAVKGAELMDKWVGASEKAVRELFRRASDSAPVAGLPRRDRRRRSTPRSEFRLRGHRPRRGGAAHRTTASTRCATSWCSAPRSDPT